MLFEIKNIYSHTHSTYVGGYEIKKIRPVDFRKQDYFFFGPTRICSKINFEYKRQCSWLEVLPLNKYFLGEIKYICKTKRLKSCYTTTSQPVFTCSKLTIETLEQGVIVNFEQANGGWVDKELNQVKK